MARSILIAGLALLALASPASAATTDLGAVAPAGATGPGCGGCTFVPVAGGSPAYVVPAGGGVITSWSVRGGASVGGADRVRLRILRPGAAGGGYTVVAEVADAAPGAGAVRSFASRLAVSAGDVLGIRLSTSGDTAAFYAGDAADTIGMALGDPGLGASTGPLVQTSGRRLNVAARLESDADRDGLGDDTQDADDDNDGLADAAEAPAGTDPLKADSDGDGSRDGADNCRAQSNRSQADADVDGSGDACDHDDDNDGISDVAEALIGTSRIDRDTDDDGLSDSREDRLDLDGRRADTDRDGLPDGLELGARKGAPDPPGVARGTDRRRFRPDRDSRTHTNPLRRDSDRDRLADGREDRNRNGRRDRRETDPRRRDTDRDNVPDGAERFPLDARR